MKRPLFVLTGLIGLTSINAFAADPPRGSVLELHSCEVYAGGCVVSSEATLGGRYMLRAWDFTGGSFNGIDLNGLQLAVLQISPDNLAAPDSQSGEAILYLPQSATPRQRDALAAWLKSSQPDLKPAGMQTRMAPLQFLQTGRGCSFSAGDFISVKASSFQSCEAAACGESLWYQPRAANSLFTVALDRSSQITEPLLKLRWDDAGKRNIFLAQFGRPDSAKNRYVSLEDWCASAQARF